MARLGLLVPSSNTSVETEFHRTLPDAVTLHVGRLFLTQVTPESVRRIVADMEGQAKLLASADVDLIVLGSRGTVEITPRELMKRDADIRAMPLVNASASELASIHAALGAGLENGTLRPVVGREMRLADAAKAHVAVLEPGAYGKIVLLP